MSQIAEVPVTRDMDASEEGKPAKNLIEGECVDHGCGPLDLDTPACDAIGKGGECVENLTKVLSLPGKEEKEHKSNFKISRGINVNLNAEDVTSPINLEAAKSHKGHDHFKLKDVPESGSCTGPLEEKDPMIIWNEMKQNDFLSPSYGGIPVAKQRRKKGKSDTFKKKMEIAKQEQVNKFTKMAEPTGLLNELNPGIINHVRNRKQVHAIIEALVRSKKNENNSERSKQATHEKNLSARELENMADGSKHQPTFRHEEGTLYSSSGIKQTRKCPGTMNDNPCISSSTLVREDDNLALKLSSSLQASMISTNLSNEESSNFSMAPSFSQKVSAATVASQWLKLLHQDIKGRLLALRRSRKRVHAVITTQLPFLLSKEFADNQENDPFAMKHTTGHHASKTADLHRVRWTALFDHMAEDLLEEEKQLVSLLNQVKEKQLLCDQGLQHVNWSVGYGLQQPGTSESDSRISLPNVSEKELAVNAAAASLYSTCNFLLSRS